MNRLRLFFLLLLALAAFGLRLTVDPGSRSIDGQVIFADVDSTYHMRRIEWIAQQYPEVPYSDRYLSHPDLGRIAWPGGYDLILGTVNKLLLVTGFEQTKIEWVLACFNPLVASLTVIAVFYLGAAIGGILSAWLAAVAVTILPGHLSYSIFSNIDHHTSNSLIAVLLVLIGVLALKDSQNKGQRKTLIACWGGVLGGAHFIHAGFSSSTLLLLGVNGLCFCCLFWPSFKQPERREQVLDRLVIFRNTFAISAVLVVFFTLMMPWERASEVIFWTLSLFQVLISLLALIVSELLLTYARGKSLRKTAAKSLVLFGIFFLIALAGRADKVLLGGLSYVFGTHWSLGVQAESLPLWQHGGVWVVCQYLGFFVFVLPLWLAKQTFYDLKKAVSGGEIANLMPSLLLLAYGSAMVVMGLGQVVFISVASVFYAIFQGQAIATLARKAGRYSIALAVVMLGLLLWPASLTAYERFSNPAVHIFWRDADRLAIFLREVSPETKGYYDPSQIPQYSVMANRDLGHNLIRKARRPVVNNPFGADDFALRVKDYAVMELAQNPEIAKAILDKYGSTYYINTPLIMSEVKYYAELIGLTQEQFMEVDNGKLIFKKDFIRSFNARLYRGDGAASIIDKKLYSAISYMRLIAESDSKIYLLDKPVSSKYKLYQLVPGASLHGKLDSKSANATGSSQRILFSLKLRTDAGREFDYRAFTTVDSNGAWALTFPYASEVNPALQVKPSGPIIVEFGAKKYSFSLSEKAVALGERIKINFE